MLDSFNICVCASGGGGNFQALIDNQKNIGYNIIKLITDRNCFAVERAKSHNISYKVINKNNPKDDFSHVFANEIPEDTDLIVLAGFLTIIPEELCYKYEGKIINIHPSLLPSYGGKGMYGVKVHETVIANKEKYTGCTVHFVNNFIDGGEIILQKKIRVFKNESAWDLGGRVFLEENRLLPQAIRLLMTKR